MRVLVIEDDPALQRQLRRALESQAYAVDAAEDGEDGWFLGDSESYDAVILDLGLPTLEGISILKKWRACGRNMPVLILTARSTWQEKVDGIDAGADDYLAKPFRVEELLARLRALIRRGSGQACPILRSGALQLDTRNGHVSVDGIPIALTSHEYRLLSYLMHHQDHVISRAELTEHLYAQDFDRDSNTIEVFIGRLRKKLGQGVITTQRGLGYRLQPPPDHAVESKVKV